MRLLLPSLFMAAYVAWSLLLMLPWRPISKCLVVLALLLISCKYVMYETLGGGFFAPQLPRWLLLGSETLYATLVLLFVLLLIKDGTALVLWFSRLLGTSWHFPVSRGMLAGWIATFALALSIWGICEGVRVPDVRTQEIVLPHLPAELDGFVIVQLTDLHIGPVLDESWLRAVVEKTNAQAPDVVAITGDFIDGSPDRLRQDVAPLGELRAKYGVYGVTGNHEYYFDVQRWLPVFAQLGVDMLNNEHRVIAANGAELVIAGINDAAALLFVEEGPNIRQALAGAPEASTRLLLAHQPRGASDHPDVDVQLSGHTHGGIMVFMKPLIGRSNDGFVSGLYTVGNMLLYTSPGTGVWSGFSSRVGVPSEITRLVLRSGAKKSKDALQ